MDWLEIGVVSAFGDDDDCFTFSNLTVLKKGEMGDGRWRKRDVRV